MFTFQIVLLFFCNSIIIKTLLSIINTLRNGSDCYVHRHV